MFVFNIILLTIILLLMIYVKYLLFCTRLYGFDFLWYRWLFSTMHKPLTNIFHNFFVSFFDHNPPITNVLVIKILQYSCLWFPKASTSSHTTSHKKRTPGKQNKHKYYFCQLFKTAETQKKSNLPLVEHVYSILGLFSAYTPPAPKVSDGI